MGIRDSFRKRFLGRRGWYSGDTTTEIKNTPSTRAENSQTKHSSILDKSHKMGRKPPRGVISRLVRSRTKKSAPNYSRKYEKPRAGITASQVQAKRKGILK